MSWNGLQHESKQIGESPDLTQDNMATVHN